MTATELANHDPANEEGAPHRLPVRVYYEDTDFSGFVYHASYLRFLERGRTEYLRGAGIDQSALYAGDASLGFAVRRMTIDWLRPARMDDLLLIDTEISEMRGASLRMAQRIFRGADALLTADVQVAVLSAGRAARLPKHLRVLLGEVPT
jgi:acyl-CoA thioester hydrolase